MRLVAVICAALAIGVADPVMAQVYPYTATVGVPGLVSPAPTTPESEPQGLAFDTVANRLLIAEGPNQIVQLLDGTSLAPVATLGVAAVGGGDAGHLSNPSSVAFDAMRNRILVADTGNDRVQVFDAASLALIGTLGESGVAGADNGHFSSPGGVAVDAANNHIVVADTANSRVQLFDASSFTFLGTIGIPGAAGPDNGHLSSPQGVAVDTTAGHILVADTGNSRIQVFDARTLAYDATIGQVGAVTQLGLDMTGRNIFAADPTDFVVAVVNADTFSATSSLGLLGSFGIDNARFMTPSGVAFDPAMGRIFVGDALLNRVQIFGQPSWLLAAVSPNGRALMAGQSATIFATIINTGATDFANCQVALPNDAPTGLSLSFQTTNPLNNLTVGQINQPVVIPAGQGQSFVLTLTTQAPLDAIGESFLFSCDGTSPAPVYSGINTADLTFAAAPTADIIAAAVTPQNSGVVTLPDLTAPNSSNSVTAFAVAAFNFGASATLQVSADSGSFYPVTGDGTAPGFYQTLPVKVQICQTNLLTGQCLSPAAAQVPVSFPSGGTETFTVFVSSLGPAIPDELQEPRLFLRFTEATGAAVPDSVGEASVAVTTAAPSQN